MFSENAQIYEPYRANQPSHVVRIRGQAYKLARQAARQHDLPLSTFISNLVRERLIQDPDPYVSKQKIRK